MPKIKVKDQMVQTGEHPQTNGRTHTDISPATRSIRKHSDRFQQLLVLSVIKSTIIGIAQQM